MAALQQQNAALEDKIKLLSEQMELVRASQRDPVATQNEIMAQRLRLAMQERSVTKLATGVESTPAPYKPVLTHDEIPIESIRAAYTSVATIAPEVAKALDCAGSNVVLFGPAQSDMLMTLRSFANQIEILKARLSAVVGLPVPAPPGKGCNCRSVRSI